MKKTNPENRLVLRVFSMLPIGLLLSVLSVLAAEVDPDRMLAEPIGWSYWFSHTSSDLKNVNPEIERLSDIELIDTGVYDEVRVRNAGSFQRDGQQLLEDHSVYDMAVALSEGGLRITDLEVSVADSPPRFTLLAVPNKGEAEKDWMVRWDYEESWVLPEVQEADMRLVDIESYEVEGRRLYAFVAILNAGEDYRDWQWYPRLSASDLGTQLETTGMRLLDIDNVGTDRFTAIAVDNSEGYYWWWGVGVSAKQIERAVATTGARLIDLESYVERGVAKHAFISLDNANRESRRLWNLSEQVFDHPAFGDAEYRGFYVKKVSGPVIADIAGHLPFQPMSVLKLLPYLYAWMEINSLNASLTQSTVSWEQALTDNPATVDFDETLDANCLVGSNIPYGLGIINWEPALQTMMWESHNRTLDAFLNLFTPSAITQRMQQIGMTQTVMHYGCDQPNDPAPWLKNRSTLADIHKLWESVDTFQAITQPALRDMFLSHMINIDSTGPSYTSPITGRTSGGPDNNTGFLWSIIQQEAGANQAAVQPFYEQVVIQSKGGGLSSGSPEYGYAFSHHVILPFKVNGLITPKTYTIGAFIFGLTEPPGCPDDSEVPSCEMLWDAEWQDWGTLVRELYRVPIAQALATW